MCSDRFLVPGYKQELNEQNFYEQQYGPVSYVVFEI